MFRPLLLSFDGDSWADGSRNGWMMLRGYLLKRIIFFSYERNRFDCFVNHFKPLYSPDPVWTPKFKIHLKLIFSCSIYWPKVGYGSGFFSNVGSGSGLHPSETLAVTVFYWWVYPLFCTKRNFWGWKIIVIRTQIFECYVNNFTAFCDQDNYFRW